MHKSETTLRHAAPTTDSSRPSRGADSRRDAPLALALAGLAGGRTRVARAGTR